jgi:hypothetical protein
MKGHTLLAVAAICAVPAMASADDRNSGYDRNYRERAKQYHGRYVGERYDNRAWRREREHREYYANGYYYNPPVYAPPAVVYAPEQTPGITLVFPLKLR